jgi:hypothetical protein
MARTQKTSTETTQDNGPVSTTNDDQTTPSGMAHDRENTSSDSKKPMVIPDPRGIMSISLGDAPGSPRGSAPPQPEIQATSNGVR